MMWRNGVKCVKWFPSEAHISLLNWKKIKDSVANVIRGKFYNNKMWQHKHILRCEHREWESEDFDTWNAQNGLKWLANIPDRQH